jgi:hypothetical protein
MGIGFGVRCFFNCARVHLHLDSSTASAATGTQAMNDFSVSFKFYDSTDARVGWDNMSVSSLQPSEKVKWKADLPLKGYPLTVDTARIQIFSYSKGTAE